MSPILADALGTIWWSALCVVAGAALAYVACRKGWFKCSK